MNTNKVPKKYKKPAKSLRGALPVLAIVIGASFALSVFVQGRLDVADRKNLNSDTIVPRDPSKPKKQFNLDEELKKMQEKIDISKWENKRVPRKEE